MSGSMRLDQPLWLTYDRVLGGRILRRSRSHLSNIGANGSCPLEGIRVVSFLALPAVLLLLDAGPAYAEAELVEVQNLRNATSLSEQEMEFLTDVVRSTFAELPRERFEIELAEADRDEACDDDCRVEAAEQRGAGKVVIGSIYSFGDGHAASLKLYDVESGQLIAVETTGGNQTTEELIGSVRNAARELRGRLETEPSPALPPAAEPVPAAQEMPQTAESSPELPTGALFGKLKVTTAPPGAHVYVHGKYSGRAPIETNLAPNSYRVEAKLADHEPVVTRVRIDPGAIEAIHLNLERIYPMNPYKMGGHACFWPGLLVTGFGFLAMGMANSRADDYQYYLSEDAKQGTRNWTGVMWGSFGVGAALIATGFVLWAMSPGDREYFESASTVALRPTAHGPVFAF